MNPITAASDIARAVIYPFRMLLVVGLCFFINVVTSPGQWWFQWVAFGMGIGLVVAWARALRTIGVAALTTGIAYLVYRCFFRRKAAGPING